MEDQNSPRSTYRSRFASDGGVSLIELVVAMGLIALLIGVVMHNFTSSNAVTRNQVSRTELWSTMQDASGQLLRDVADGTKIETATAQTVVLYTVRDELCQRRSYAVDAAAATLSVTTDWFAQASCAGPTESKTDILVRDYAGLVTFSFFNELDRAIPAPVQDVRNVTRVGWTLKAHPTGATNDVTLASGSVFRGKSDASGSGSDSVSAQAPILSVTTNLDPTLHEGVSKPVLSWVDATPSVTTGWTVYRVSNPEGATTGARTWTLIATLPNPAASTYTDAALQPGYNAVYVVQATTNDPNGQAAPTSNQVVTGLRPSAIANLAAVGAAQSITLTWTAPVGQVGADVYRDGVLFDRVAGATATYVDAQGKRGWPAGAFFGHSHTYRVVPTNRWEQLAYTGSQTTSIALDDLITKVYLPGVTGMTTRASSNAAGDFTAPAAPIATVVANNDWTYTVSWSAAPWVGAGPTTVAGLARDRTWAAYRNANVASAAPSGTWNALWGGVQVAASVPSKLTASYGSTDGGTYGNFRLYSCNRACGAGTTVTAIMRPKAPANCAAAGVTSRATTVTVSPAATNAPNTGSSLTGGTPASGYAVTGTGSSAGFVYNVDQLAHATTSTFTATVTNAGGVSDQVSCSATTLTVAVSTPTWSSTTRSINASATSSNATDSNITLEGIATQPGLTGSWDPLTDGTPFTVTARAGDGVNNVAATAAAATQVLAAPAAPTCTITYSDLTVPGALTFGGGDQVKLGSGGSVYSSPRAYSALAAGSYTGYARSLDTDGYNTTASGWDSCPTKTVTDPYPSAWGDRAGCPGVAVYVSPGDSYTYQVRRTGTNACEGRRVVTDAGFALGVGAAGEVVALYSNTVTSPGSWVKTSGSAGSPSSLPWAP